MANKSVDDGSQPAHAPQANMPTNTTSKAKKDKTGKNKTNAPSHQNGDDIPVPQLFDSRALDLLDDRGTASTSTITNTNTGNVTANQSISKQSNKKRKHQNEVNSSVNPTIGTATASADTITPGGGAEPKKKKHKKTKVSSTDANGGNNTANAGESAVSGSGSAFNTTDGTIATKEKKSKSKKDKTAGNAAHGSDPALGQSHEGGGAVYLPSVGVEPTAIAAQSVASSNQNGEKEKKKKKKTKEIDGVPETPEQRIARKQRKEEKKAKKLAKAQAKEAKAASKSNTISGVGQEQQQQHQPQQQIQPQQQQQYQQLQQHRSPVPNAQSLPPLMRNNSHQPQHVSGNENIDPALWSATTYRPPPARSVSVAGSTSILPRDPSLAPGDGQGPSSYSGGGGSAIEKAAAAARSSGNLNERGSTTGDDIAGTKEKKARGRPKKIVGSTGISEIPGYGNNDETRNIAPATSAVITGQRQPVASTSGSNSHHTGAVNRPASTGTSAAASASTSARRAIPTTSSRPQQSNRPTGSNSEAYVTATAITPSRLFPLQGSNANGQGGGVYTAQPAYPAPPASSAIVTNFTNDKDNVNEAATASLMANANANTAARAALNPNFKPTPLPDNIPQLAPSENKLVHQELLATRWLSAKEISELVDREGLRYRAGKFSKAEDAVLKNCMDNYRDQQNLTDEQIRNIINTKGKDVRADYGDFWIIMARSLPDRPLMSVYHHIKRLTQPGARQGAWTAEEDERLKAAYKQYGPQWETMSHIVGRWGADCRDRWRNYIHPSEFINKGAWSKEEEDNLRTIVNDMRKELGNIVNDHGSKAIEDEPAGGSEMFWSRVAKKLGTRSRHQCRIKWNDHMKNKILAPDGRPIRWSKRDYFLLIMKLHSLNVTDEHDIAWKLLPDSHWNWWSPHILHKRWVTLKARALRGLKKTEATYSEMVNFLKAEQDAIPRKQVRLMMARWRDHKDILEMSDKDAEGEITNEFDERFDKASKKGMNSTNFRTSEFVNSDEDADDDEDGEENEDEAEGEGDDGDQTEGSS